MPDSGVTELVQNRSASSHAAPPDVFYARCRAAIRYLSRDPAWSWFRHHGVACV